MVRMALVVPMLPLPCSRMSVWNTDFEMMTPQGIDPSRKQTTTSSASATKTNSFARLMTQMMAPMPKAMAARNEKSVYDQGDSG